MNGLRTLVGILVLGLMGLVGMLLVTTAGTTSEAVGYGALCGLLQVLGGALALKGSTGVLAGGGGIKGAAAALMTDAKPTPAPVPSSQPSDEPPAGT
jgi:hypothetical protein